MADHSTKARRVIAPLLSLALGFFGVFNTGSTLAAKNPKNTSSDAPRNSQRSSQVIVTGSVRVNDNRAITGTTVCSESRIAVACAKGSSALITLGRLGRIELAAGSKLVLRFSDGLI